MGAGERWVRVALIAMLVCGASATGTAEAAPLLTAPSAQITSGPPSDHGSRTATFTFTSDDPTATFQCRLDEASYAACTSPKTYSGLAQASHLFEVRAVDLLGNAGTPAGWSFAVVGPETTITGGPSDTVHSDSVSFTFTGSPSPVGFECALDGATFQACTSPAEYSDQSAGWHTFRVRAVGNEGLVDPTPATRGWSNEPQGDLSVSLSATPERVKSSGRITYSVVVTNVGPARSLPAIRLDLPSGVTLESFTFPDGFCVHDDSRVGCNPNAALEPGTSTTLVVLGTVNRGTRGPLTAMAWVEHTRPDPDSSNDSASVTTRVGNK